MRSRPFLIPSAEDCVELIEWVPFDKVNSYIAASRACLVPFESLRHTQASAPHKLFQYMLMEKPVVVSSCASLERIINETGAGLVFRAGDPADLARCLIQLFEDKDGLAERLARNGRKAALSGPYSWKTDARRLVEAYRSLEQERR